MAGIVIPRWPEDWILLDVWEDSQDEECASGDVDSGSGDLQVEMSSDVSVGIPADLHVEILLCS